ncbi:phosphoenolpyruvate--protein phosphotransferase [Leifsonia sp. H3M29-4]|uniref:phosphoenolpyruvate--protein phosphotransferase n=1 Tax=Salinibacterium metalliresistens TaxID=3031321 RepID=UPI0023DB92F1|nr:phosphoenolpyruvate--protein phosphotransferase [Salinibacterium metalliresistens]MDF1479104.1 phosphoenolpyruvate--protein phosphotransferase [Salinibacterium metalliresistens]
MELLGTGVGRGVVVGRVLRMPPPLAAPTPAAHDGDADAELRSVLAALAAVADDLTERARNADPVAGAVLQATAMMVADPMIADDVATRVRSGSAGEWAVFEAFGVFERSIAALGGDLAERAADVRDVAQRVIARLRGVAAPGVPTSDAPFVLVAHDLAPADTAVLDLDLVLGFVTRDGGPTSHTAILARSRAIPAVVGVADALDLVDGMVVMVDAASGRVTVDPGAAAIAAVPRSRPRRGGAASARTGPGALADGTRVALLANVGSVDDAVAAVACGAEGIGLLRTEFLFMGEAVAPSVERQVARYVEVFEHFPARPVVVRVFDAGVDKPLAFLPGGGEQNPALGVRGLRALRANGSVLDDQLAALARAQELVDAQVWVMAPMVADAGEATWFVERARAAGLRTLGVTAEVPSLAMMAREVAALTDFVSVGTNDLTQYLLAADRSQGALAAYQDPWHPAVLRTIALFADAAVAAGKPVGVCGEAASDPALAVVLAGLGITSLSMAPAAIGDVRAELSSVTLTQARARAAAALGASTAGEARALAG